MKNMKLILSDNSELEIQQYEYIASGDDEGGIRVIIHGITIEELVEKLKAKLDDIAIKTDSDETVYSLKNGTLGNVISKDIGAESVTFTIKPQTQDFYIAQNTADIAAINEAIADLAASVRCFPRMRG